MSQIKHVSVGLIVGITSLAMLAFTGCDVGVGNKDLMARAKARRGTSSNNEEENAKKKAPSITQPRKAPQKKQKRAEKTKKADGSGIKEKQFVAASKDPVKLPPEKTDQNLKSIFKALVTTGGHVSFPAYANFTSRKIPLLSWRVHILPALGYENLYKKFNRNEPWDSNHNLDLLSQMPPEFKSSGIGEFKTTYLAPRSTNSVFFSRTSCTFGLIEDGVANTVVLIDSAPKFAVEWTRPDDLVLPPRQYKSTLTSGGNFKVVWGNGRVSELKSSLNEKELYAMISIDGGEPISLSRYSVDPPKMNVDGAKVPENVAVKDDVPLENLEPEGPQILESVAELKQLTIDKLAKRRQKESFRNYYASLVLDDRNDEVSSAYNWISGLKRPVAGMQIGVAVDAPRKQKSPIEKTKDTSKEVVGPGASMVKMFSGYVGDRILFALKKPFADGAYGENLHSDRDSEQKLSKFSEIDENEVDEEPITLADSFSLQEFSKNGFEPVMFQPGIVVLGLYNRATMLELARRHDLDLLALIKTQSKPVSRAGISHSTQLYLINVETGKTIYESGEVNNIKVAEARRDPLAKDPVLVEQKKLEKFIEENLTGSPMPNFSANAVRSRIKRLLEMEHRNPLKAMAEVRFYHSIGKFSTFETMKAFEVLANQKDVSFKGAKTPTYAEIKLLIEAEEVE